MADEEKIEILKAEFPSNSKTVNSPVEKIPGDERLKKVVSGKVKQKPRGLGKRMGETFLEEDSRSVGGYILYDVVIPAIKELIFKAISGGVETALFGGRGAGTPSSSSIRRDRGRSYVNYGAASYRGAVRDDRGGGREITRTNRARHNFDEIVLESRGEAEEVLSILVDRIQDYGQATVADLYDLVGITETFADHRWGWTDVRNSSVSRVSGGYLINLPRPVPLD